MIARRGLLTALVGLVAAPAIVKVADLMPINSGLLAGDTLALDEYTQRILAAQLTVNDITREAVRLFENSNLFLKNLDHQYDEHFAAVEAKIGSQLRIRLPNDYVSRDLFLDGYQVFDKRGEIALDLLESKMPASPMPAVAAVALGAAAVVASNPVVSRRFWDSKS